MADIPLRPASPKRVRVLFYAGPSMNPLLRENDLLEISPCRPGSARAGDVIAFENRSARVIVVHRVVADEGRGLITRGDNNGSRDIDPVRADQLIGRVTVGWRGAARFEIAGGRRGLMAARIRWLRRACGTRIGRLSKLMLLS